MWIKTSILLLKLLMLLHLLTVDRASGIYSNPQISNPAHSTTLSGSSLAPHLYKYLKGYYQNGKGASSKEPPVYDPRTFSAQFGSQGEKKRPPFKYPKRFGRKYLQPKAGLSSGQYNFAQSREYLKKLRQLADILKARVADRAQKSSRNPPTSQRQPPVYRPPVQQPVQQSYPVPNVPAPSYAPRPPAPPAPQPPPPQPIQPSYPPQIPQVPVVAATYRVPIPAAPQPSYNQVQPPQIQVQPRPVQPPQIQVQPRPVQPPQVQVVVPGPASGVSYQSMGLPLSRSPGYQAPSRPSVPTITAPPTTAKSKVDTEALVKILKASYSSLLPLIMNQAKMTSYGVQTIPVYGSNPYRVFGPMTYGPIPKPNLNQMKLLYNPQSFQSNSFSNSGFSGYNSGGNSGSASQTSYGREPSSGRSGYGDGGGFDLGSADITCGPISAAFCQGREAGHYSHPASSHCFVQCDHVGQGSPRSCSPGTSWKALGPEPALFNYCS